MILPLLQGALWHEFGCLSWKMVDGLSGSYSEGIVSQGIFQSKSVLGRVMLSQSKVSLIRANSLDRIPFRNNPYSLSLSGSQTSCKPLHRLRPVIKTQYDYLSHDDTDPHMSSKETPYTAPELAKLKKEYGQLPHESETEYVFRVSLTGGDYIQLSEQEARNTEVMDIALVKIFLPGEDNQLLIKLVIGDIPNNLLGMDVLAGRQWEDDEGYLWSFGTPRLNIRLLQVAPHLPFSKITNVKQYPFPSGAKEGIKPVIQDLRDQGVIINAHSPFNSPVWPVRKPNGKWRLTVDFRRFNANTEPLTAAVPNLAELITSI
ncbi:hypothetical protein TURU_006377 [Turdus rufiventris]|nr:hypothetical protein TURU_006377 [Turdus rufiventris]